MLKTLALRKRLRKTKNFWFYRNCLQIRSLHYCRSYIRLTICVTAPVNHTPEKELEILELFWLYETSLLFPAENTAKCGTKGFKKWLHTRWSLAGYLSEYSHKQHKCRWSAAQLQGKDMLHCSSSQPCRLKITFHRTKLYYW